MYVTHSIIIGPEHKHAAVRLVETSYGLVYSIGIRMDQKDGVRHCIPLWCPSRAMHGLI